MTSYFHVLKRWIRDAQVLIRPRLTIAIVSIMFVLSMIAVLMISNWSLTPPSNVKSLSDFQLFCPEPAAIVKVNASGNTYYVLFGRQALEVSAEAPSAYLFGEAGQLIAWTTEASDVDPNQLFWNLANAEMRAGRILRYRDIILNRGRKEGI
jgi:hypothetical protein